MKNQYKIASLNPTRLDHNDFIQLLLDTKAAILAANKGLKQDIYTKKLAELDSLLAEFQVLSHKSRTSQHSQALMAADKERGAAFVTLKQMVKAFSRVKEEAVKLSYQKLTALFKDAQKDPYLNYEKETELINFLVTTLRSESYQADVTRLNLTNYVTALANAQKAFEKVYAQRVSERDAKVPHKPRDLRLALQDIYDSLVDFTAIYTHLNPELVGYKNLHKSLNTIRSIYKTHESRKKTKTEEPKAETTPEADVVKEA